MKSKQVQEFKDTAIGKIPLDWEVVLVGDISASISKTHTFEKDNLIFLNTGDIKSGKILHHNYTPTKNFPGQAKKSIKKNDILFSEIRPRNERYAFVDFDSDDYIVSTKLMVIRSKDSIFPRYLYRFLTSDKILNHLQHIAETRSGTFPQITFDEVTILKIPMPSIEEQTRIVNTSLYLENKILNLQNQNKILEQIAQTIFKSWFIDFDGITEFDDSELGKIPKGWKVIKFSDVAEILSGGTPSTKHEEYWDGNVKWVTIDDLKQGIFITNTEKKITELGLEKSSTKLLPKHTIVISARGTVGVFSIMAESMCINQSCYGLRGKNTVNEIYLFFLLRFSLVNFLQNVHGSVFDTITRRTFEEINVISPPNDKIKQFQNYMSSTFEIILKNQLQIQLMTKIRDSLLPKLMSGEIRV